MKDALGFEIPDESTSKKSVIFRNLLRLALVLLGLGAAGGGGVAASNYIDSDSTVSIENFNVLSDSLTFITNELEHLKYQIAVLQEAIIENDVSIEVQTLRMELQIAIAQVQKLDEEYYRHLEIYHSYYK